MSSYLLEIYTEIFSDQMKCLRFASKFSEFAGEVGEGVGEIRLLVIEVLLFVFGGGYNLNLYLSLYLRIFILKNFKYWAKRKVEVEVSSQSSPSAPLSGDGWGRWLSRRVWNTWLPCRLWPAHKVPLALMMLENILN